MALLTGGRARRAIGPDVAVALAAGLALSSCSDREHLNPLDPDNPATGGTPWIFTARAESRAVELDWLPLPFGDLGGFRLARSSGGAPESTIARLGPEVGSYRDSNLANGTEVQYRLVPFLTDETELQPDGPALATPGPQVAWVVDTGAGLVSRLTPDGRAVVDRARGLISPVAAAVNPADHRVWVTDTFRGRIVAIDLEGELTEIASGYDSPEAIAIPKDGSSVWVADEVAGVVDRLSPTGLPLGRNADFSAPAEVAVGLEDGSAWVIDRGRGEAVRLDSTLVAVARATGLVEPLGVVAVPADTSAWVADFGADQVLHVAKDGTVVAQIGPIASPIGLAIDPATGDLWLASFAAGTVERYRTLGGPPERIASTTGFSGPTALAADPTDGGVWVVDQVADTVVKLDQDGREIGRTQGYERPFDVAVDPSGGEDLEHWPMP
jgi:DNA-binding beta-propeller fold protein YncE